jgi:hypothetical protein
MNEPFSMTELYYTTTSKQDRNLQKNWFSALNTLPNANYFTLEVVCEA